MQQTPYVSRRAWKRRALSLVLAAIMVLGLVPGFPGADSEASAHWADPYLSQLVEWGFIRADQANNPDRALTRADFMAIVNRAYGYSEVGETPFEDVKETDWFYDDVGIAYNAQYIKGTSPTTAPPGDPLTRETATTILGRNMMLQDSPGEILDFTDARQISNWAMGTVKSSLEHYLVSGYDDGTFRPQRNVSWGEMATMVTRLIGTPLQEAGDYALGGTFGNVTISSPNVTLRDTVASGDVYVTGGVGLGGVALENVNVLGRIIASGTGRSEGGAASILLRNVTADEMLVDNLQDNYVSIQADGITQIGRTTVRTSAYIEDNTPEGMGLQYISLEGDSYPEGEEPDGWEPIQLDLAGRIGEVVNRTPRSQIRVAKGTVEKLTVDEAATDSTVIIDRGAVVKELNLDTATTVTGEGDIEHLVVNAPGCVIDILPDTITIRPGITAIIAGVEMDSVAAEEHSMDPLILAGYPQARDITPTGLEAVFMTNKAGTVYWAVSAMNDGSVGEEELIKPPSYGNIAIRNGSVNAPKGNEEFSSAITGLTPGGSYYLSAVLEDARGQRSPVKVISFTTPDNTVPAFCEGYPHMSKVSPKDSVVVVMPNKDCKMYYALLPQGAMAPTEDELRTGAVSGALGYGVRDVYKNTEDVFRVNDQILEEKTTYVIYFFLTDADGVNKSGIISLTFTTDDETPPEFIIDPTPKTIQATSVGLTFRLNEDGIVYWVAVPAGTVYPKPQPGTDYETAPLTSDYAKLQVSSGMNIGADGVAGQVNAVENVDGTITVSGLKPESAYDFYYVAKDNAGPDRNYSVTVKKITINTLDTNGPKFTQRFSKTSGTDNTVDPMADTNIWLDVSENIRYSGPGGGRGFLELYQDVKNATSDAAKKAAMDKLAANLHGSITLYKVVDNTSELVGETHSTANPFTEDMTIDYTQATVESKDGGIRITFPSEGLHLENGTEYYFTIHDLTDTSNNQNPLENPDVIDFKNNPVVSAAAGHNVPPFIVEFAKVWLTSPGVGPEDGPIDKAPPVGSSDKYARVDLSFRMRPDSTSTVADNLSYDILLWSDSIVTYDLYYRVLDSNEKPLAGTKYGKSNVYPSSYPSGSGSNASNNYSYLLPRPGTSSSDASAAGVCDENGWIYLGPSGDVNPSQGSWSGKSVNKYFNGCSSTSFPLLKNLRDDLRYEFVITLKSYKGNDEFSTWNGRVQFHVNVAAGQSNNLDNLAGNVTADEWTTFLNGGMSNGGRSIGRWYDSQNQLTDTQLLYRNFSDSSLPQFFGGAPTFSPVTSSSVTINMTLTTPGTVYYAIGKATSASGTPEITTTRKILDGEEDSPNITPSGSGNMYVTLTGPNPPTNSGSVAMPNWMKGSDATTTAELNAAEDDPGTPNKVLTPTALNIFSPGSWMDTSKAITGSHPCAGIVQETEVVNNLEPNTDYFAYFVIKGESDELSHVYIYHFKTEETAKPQINPTNGNDGSVNIWTHIPSNYVYRLYTEADINNVSILSQPFANYLDTTGNIIPTGKEIPNCYATNDEGGVFTVLDALLKPYAYGTANSGSTNSSTAYFPTSQTEGNSAYSHGASVFDIYASANARELIDNVIRDAVGSGDVSKWIDEGSGTIATGGKEGEVNHPLAKIEAGTRYVILIAAQSPEMTSSPGTEDTTDAGRDGFRAFSPIQKSAGEAPNLVNAYMQSPLQNLGGTGVKGPYSGSIMLTFDKALYYEESTNVYRPVDGPFFAENTGTAGVAVRPMGSGTSFELSFSNLGNLGSITVGSQYRFCNVSGAMADEVLRISMKRRSETVPAPTDQNPNATTTKTYVYLVVEWGQKGLNQDYQEFILDEYEEEDINGGTTTPAVTDFTISDASLVTGSFIGSVTNGCNYGLDFETGRTSATLQATLNPSAGTEYVQMTWTASPSGVVSINPRNSGHEADITALTAGTTRITVSLTSQNRTITKTIYVTVTGSIDNIRLQARSADTSEVTGDATSGFIWKRKVSGSCTATLSFSTGLATTVGGVTVVSSNPSYVSVGTASVSGSTVSVDLTYLAQTNTPITITITLGNEEKEVKITLDGTSDSGNTPSNGIPSMPF